MVLHAVNRMCFALELAGETTQVGIKLRLQIGNNQPSAVFGAEDNVRKEMKKGPAHIHVAPLGLGRLASMLPTARAVGCTISPAAQADNSSNTPASNMTSLQAIAGFGNIENWKNVGSLRSPQSE